MAAPAPHGEDNITALLSTRAFDPKTIVAKTFAFPEEWKTEQKKEKKKEKQDKKEKKKEKKEKKKDKKEKKEKEKEKETEEEEKEEVVLFGVEYLYWPVWGLCRARAGLVRRF